MDSNTIRVGQRVVILRKAGVVVRVGACYWPGCKYGRDCVEVQLDEMIGRGTMNYRAAMVEPEPEPEPVDVLLLNMSGDVVGRATARFEAGRNVEPVTFPEPADLRPIMDDTRRKIEEIIDEAGQ